MDAASLPDLDGLDVQALKALLLQPQERHRKALYSKSERIEHLELMVEKLRRMLFGAKSEKAAIQLAQLEQLELELEELVIAQASEEMVGEAKSANGPLQLTLKSKPFRKPLPKHLPREVVLTFPSMTAAPVVEELCASLAKI